MRITRTTGVGVIWAGSEKQRWIMTGRLREVTASGEPAPPRQTGGRQHMRTTTGHRRAGARWFFLTYLHRELRRRRRQAILIAIGLGVGIGLVATVSAASAGVSDAQGAVLHSLYGIGTDVTVTTASKPPPNPSTSRGHVGSFSPGSRAQKVDYLHPAPGLGGLDASSVTSISRLHDVAAAAGGLSLQDTQFTVPSQAQIAANGGKPPASAFGTTITVDGIDLQHLGLGPFASGKITSGRAFTASDASSNVAVVDSSYAKSSKLRVGSTVTAAFTKFKIIGITEQPQGGGSVDVYIPLSRAQALATSPTASSFHGKVNTIYVTAASASDTGTVQAEISRLLPSATVTSSSSLASQVSGSLASAASLITDLGRWLAIVVLIAAFAVASLLTMAAVTRRVRELGTLKALGWKSRRIVAQLMAELLVVGIAGAAIGIALGFAGAGVIDAIAPKLSATVSSNPGSAPATNTIAGAGGVQHPIAQGAEHTIEVHLSAHLTLSVIALAVVLAIAGALIAAAVGGWRAARLRPAAALAQVA
jgi:putative ABC transport system permease protein